MGYTHTFSYKKAIPKAAWGKITVAFDKVASDLPLECKTAGGVYPNFPVKIQFEDDESLRPQVDEDQIRFNGVEDLGHETFLLSRRKNEGADFCKTARKPYDFAVCAVLILVEHYAPGCRDISSNGDAEEWAQALSEVRRILGNDQIRLPPRVAGQRDLHENEYTKIRFNTENEWFFA